MQKLGRMGPESQEIRVESRVWWDLWASVKVTDCVTSTPTYPVATPVESLHPAAIRGHILGSQVLRDSHKFWGAGTLLSPISLFGSLSTLLPALPQAEPRDSGGGSDSPQLTTHSQKKRQEQEPGGRSKDPHDAGNTAGHRSPSASGMWCCLQVKEEV